MYAFDVAYEMIRRPVDAAARPAGRAVRRRREQAQPAAVVLLPPADGPPAAARAARRRAGRCGWSGRSSSCRSARSASPCACRSRSTALEELVAYHDLRFNDGTYLYDEVRQLAEDVRRELRAVLRPPGRAARRRGGVHRLLHQLPRSTARRRRRAGRSAEDWLDANRREIAALLTEEPDPGTLSRAGGRGIDRQVLQLLRARPGRHRLGRGPDRRRAAVLRRDAVHHGAGQPAARRAGGVRPDPRRRGRARLPRPRRPAVPRLAARPACSASCARSASTSPA